MSRWHKYAERLDRQIAEQVHLIDYAFGTMTVPTYMGPTQIDTLRRLSERGRQALHMHRRLLAAKALIRSALSREGVRVGTSEKLARINTIEQQLSLLIRVFCRQHPSRLEIGEIERFFARMEAARRPVEFATTTRNSWLEEEGQGSAADPEDTMWAQKEYSGSKGVDVQLLDRAQIIRLEQRILALRAEKFRLQDEIAAANTKPLTAELPEEMIALVTGG